MSTMTVPVEISLDDLREGVVSLPRSEARSVIKAIDLGIADVGFTSNLIIDLLESVKSDIASEHEEEVCRIIERLGSILE